MKLQWPLESAEGKALKSWADYHPIAREYLFHIPNGGYRNAREAKNLQLQGLKSGVPDYFLSYPVHPYHGLYIELKRRSKSISITSNNQKLWIIKLNKVGYKALEAYGWEEAAKIIENYLSGGV